MDAVLFSALWPQWAAPKTASWVVENIPAGRVRDSKLSFAADLGAAEGVRKLYDVEGDIKLRNAELIWARGAKAITNIDTDIYWDNDAFTASFLTGRIDDIALQRGRIVIEPVLDDIQKNAMISLNAKGQPTRRWIWRAKLACHNMAVLTSAKSKLMAKLNSALKPLCRLASPCR
jgi:hypothetical protein